jgi:vacuolar-type H+-ATPase subunit C/Vma6
MKRSSRQVYLLAKVYGVVAHSWLGAHFRELLRLKSLADLHGLLWPAPAGEAPASPSAEEMETLIVQSAVAAMESILDELGRPEDILLHMLRKFEYRNLKIVLRGLGEGRADTSRVVDLGAYAALRLRGVSDVEKAIRSSPYAWTLDALKSASREKVENQVDRQYYEELLRLARALSSGDRLGVMRYVNHEVTFANAVWALRLRFSFGMDEQASRPLMITGTGEMSRRAIARAFEIPADSVEEWRKWRYGWLLDDQLGEVFRAPDPVSAEARASQRLYTRAHQLLHQFPFSVCPFVAFFALKQQEAALLRTAVEAVAMGVPEKDALAMAGVRVPAGAATAPGAQS